MATYNACKTVPAIAGASQTSGIYLFAVYTTTANTVIVNTTANGAVDGILYMNAASGAATVLALPDGGLCKVQLAGTLAPGDRVESDNAGKAVAYSDTADHQCLGTIVEGGASGDVGTITFAHKGTGGS